MRFTLASIALALAAPSIVGAGGLGAVEGTVIDQSLGKPVASAFDISVVCGAVRKTVRSDARGHFVIDKLPEGTCTITLVSGKYETTVLTITVSASSTTPMLANVITREQAAQWRRQRAEYEKQVRTKGRRYEFAGDDIAGVAGGAPQPAPPAGPPRMAPPRPRPDAKPVDKAPAKAPQPKGATAAPRTPAPVVAAQPVAPAKNEKKDLNFDARGRRGGVALRELDQGGEIARNINQGWALVRVFPVPERPARYDGPRDDFRETVYWNGAIETNAAGEAEVAFPLSDATTSFRATVEGFAATGLPGGGHVTFESVLPLAVDARLPVEVTSGDSIRLPVTLTNGTPEALEVSINAKFGAAFKLASDPVGGQKIRVPAKQNQTIFFPLDVVATAGSGSVELTIAGGGIRDEIKKMIRVVPKGFPMEASVSGTASRGEPARHTVDLAGALAGTLDAKVTMYPSPVAQMASGMEGMIREPGGCFEQASSTNYPNIMILGYMQATGSKDPALVAKTQGVLAKGYKLLTGYESPERGYEWFGSNPGHEALTAYGLMEFADMAKVFEVDRSMVDRTASWLHARRDGKGGFQRNAKALDSFGRASPAVTDAYIMWALAEARRTSGMTAEIAAQKKLGMETSDPYLLALAANTNAVAAPSAPETASMIKRLAAMQGKDGGFAGAKESITMSGGESLAIETTALASLALIKGSPKREYDAQLRAATEYLNSKRGGFGSWSNTQATILGLKAMSAYAEHSRVIEAGGAATLVINGKDAGTIRFVKGRKDPHVWEKLGDKLTPGKNTIEVRLDSAASLPYAVAIEYRSAQPATSPRAKVALSTQLLKSQTKMGEGITLRTRVENKTNAGIPMTLARVGLPGGMVFQTWQLKELRDKGLIDFYETRPREVILYWRALPPNAKKDVDLNLLAQTPGTYEAPASSAYLYYTTEDKSWTKPVAIKIEP